MDSEYSPVALDGVSLSFKEIIDLRIPLKADKILNRWLAIKFWRERLLFDAKYCILVSKKFRSSLQLR